MLIVGLTGGIASGKSTVAGMFDTEGARLISLDEISRKVVQPGTAGWEEILNVFGKKTANDDGTINRKKLGDIIFSDPEQRKRLEDILHPKIHQEQVRQVKDILRHDENAIVIIDIPLLIEVRKQESVDKVILVYVPAEMQLNRLVKRDGLSVEEAQKRISAQDPIESKRKYAHYIIDNQGSLESTRQQVKEIWGALRKVESNKRRRVGSRP